MPIEKYFEGSGDDVMASMKKTYGDTKKAKQVFYATANEKGMKPKKVAKKSGPRKTA